jgi:hypothetical protein
MSAIAFMATIFSFGAAAGVGLAWWLTQPIDTLSSTGVVASSVVKKAPPPSPAKNGLVGSRTGIDPSELPYDGKPPSAKENRNASTASSGTSEAPEERAAMPAPVATAAPASGVVNSALPAPVPEKKQTRGQAALDAEDDAAVPAARSEANKAPQRKVAKATPHYRTQQHATTDKEIERIKQQAADELKKKIENQRLSAQARTDARPRPVSKHAQLARCERASNFILKEQCKWQVCNGMWGKNGCPSYEVQVSY